MSNKKLGAILLTVALLVVGAYILVSVSSNSSDNNSSTSASDSSTTKSDDDTTKKSAVALTVAEVKKHNSEEDCWTIIEGKVYDITGYVSGHPGGKEVLRACGVDGTTLFTERKTTDGDKVGSGTPHSSNASSQLERFLVGPLEN